MNLLIKTQEDIKSSGHTTDDIIFIGSQDGRHQRTWNEFIVLADRDYDNGFGASKVADDLIIVFSDITHIHLQCQRKRIKLNQYSQRDVDGKALRK